MDLPVSAGTDTGSGGLELPDKRGNNDLSQGKGHTVLFVRENVLEN